MGSNTMTQHKLHFKAIITFKEGWGKLYYTQHTLLSNVGQSAFFFFETHTHKERESYKKVIQSAFFF